MRTRTKLGMAVAAIAMGLISTSAKAVIVNGGFESGDLNGYTSLGDAAALDSSYHPSEGSFIGGISNTATQNGPSFSGSLASTNIPAVDTAAGLAAGTLEGHRATSGSVLSQTFFATAGDTVTFTYNFLTNEEVGLGNNDQAFYSLRTPSSSTGTFNLLASAVTASPVPVNVAPTLTPGENGIYNFLNSGSGRETGNLTSSISISQSGLYTISFGVINADSVVSPGDVTNPSALLVDNITGATGNASGVPLPLAAFIAPLGLAVAGRYGKKFRRQQA